MKKLFALSFLALLSVQAHAAAPCGGSGQAVCPAPYLSSPLTFQPGGWTLSFGSASPTGAAANGSLYASPTALYQYLSGTWTALSSGASGVTSLGGMTGAIACGGIITCTGGTISATGSTYTLPVAGAASLGGILANTGSAGQYVSGVNTSTGALIYGTPTGAYTLPAATVSTLGGVTVSTGLNVSSGALSVAYGTTAGTAAQGNDSRITGAVQSSSVGAASGVAPLDSGALVPVANLPAAAKRPTAIAFDFSGVPAVSQQATLPGMPWACTIPSGATGATSFVTTLATGSTVFTVYRNSSGTVTTIGTLTFTSSSATGTWSVSSSVSVLTGDALYMTAPGTPDATWASGGGVLVCN